MKSLSLPRLTFAALIAAVYAAGTYYKRLYHYVENRG